MAQTLKPVRARSYLAKDFDSFRAQLLEYAKTYYPDKLTDFSEASLGGLFLDMAAMVGDNLSFYLDHQFKELDVNTAVEDKNIEASLRSAGVPIMGAAPAQVLETFYVQVPAASVNNGTVPSQEALPIINAGSVFTADNGVKFSLTEDVDYSKIDSSGVLVADTKAVTTRSTSNPTAFVLSATGMCMSGEETSENVQLGDFVPFRRVTLSNPNVTQIVSVYDSDGNTYYEVSSLTSDVVYKSVTNFASDNDIVRDAIKIVPAPYRFTTSVDLSTRTTTLVFGGGSADTLEDDVIPDPTDFALALPYGSTFSRVSINPDNMLNSKTLGIAAANVTLTVVYRYGGGLFHNVPANSLRTKTSLKMTFPGNPSPAVAGNVRNSLELTNSAKARGGEDAPSVDELKQHIPAIKNSQERIVSRPDIVARVYSLPTNFGRAFRVAAHSNPRNPLATQLFVICRDADKNLVPASDTLKQNLVKYLNPYRMITDSIDVLDARVINLHLNYEILVGSNVNKNITLQQTLSKLQKYFNVKNVNIDQPIVIDELKSIIYDTLGVVAVNNISFTAITGIVNNRTYEDNTFDVTSATKNGVIFAPVGGMFFVRYPDVDIVGKAM